MSRWRALMALLAPAVVLWFASCGGGGHSPAATPARASPSQSELPPSSSPTGATPSSVARTSFVELPRDAGGAWTAEGLVPGRDEALLYYQPRASSAEERANLSARLALFSLTGGSPTPFHTLARGDQVGAHASDGSYVAWVDIGIFGVKPLNWRLFTLSLMTGEVSQLDSGSGEVPGLPPLGPPLDLANGVLAYSRYVADGADWQSQIVTVDLAAGQFMVVSAASRAATGNVVAAAWDGRALNWLTRSTPAGSGPRVALNTLDGSSGTLATTQLSSEITNLAAGGGVLAAASSSQILIRAGAGALAAVASSEVFPGILRVAGGRVWWIDASAHQAKSIDLNGGEVVSLDTDYTADVFSDGTIVAWQTVPDLAQGRVAQHFYLSWMDVPR